MRRFVSHLSMLLLATSPAFAQTEPVGIKPDPKLVAPQQEAERQSANLPQVSISRVDEAVLLRVENGELVIKSGQPENESPVKLDIAGYGGFTTLLVQGKTGGGVSDARNIQFDHWDFAAPGTIQVKTSVSSTVGSVNIARFTESLGTESSVQLIQNNLMQEGGKVVSLHVQKSVNATGRTTVDLHLSAPTVADLRRNYPKETAEYLQPIFHDLQQEAAVFSIDPRAGWQVFAEAYTPDDRDKAKVAEILPRLDADSSKERQKASEALQAMGEPAAMILLRQDRSKLSAEQNSRVDAFLATYLPLSEAEATQMRKKPDFLLDCLYTNDAFVRAHALAQLEKITGQKLEFNQSLEGEARFDAVAKIRAQLHLGPTTNPSTTRP